MEVSLDILEKHIAGDNNHLQPTVALWKGKSVLLCVYNGLCYGKYIIQILLSQKWQHITDV